MTLGRTIAELQSVMTVSEMNIWAGYRNKYGPLNPVRKYDAGAAIVASMISNANGGKAKPIDFMPYGKEQKDDIVSGDEFLSMLSQAKGVKLGKRR